MLFKLTCFIIPALSLMQGLVATAIALKGAPTLRTSPLSPSLLTSLKIPTTSSNTGFQHLANPADNLLLLCASENCSGDCIVVNITGLAQDTCFEPSDGFAWVSAGVVPGNGLPLPFETWVAQLGCFTPAFQITLINECSDLIGENQSFGSFFFLPIGAPGPSKL